ncbi:MAG: cyclic nucleotide-binding domain-containing protein [Spirochaetia bacterium]|nr:cyclic nucleotide-binding domain-containing protein [Spirochaetia bacterium]
MSAVSQNPGANQNVQQKQPIILQGGQPASLVILNQGKVSYRMADAEEKKSASAGKFLFGAQGPFVLGGGMLAANIQYPYSVIAETPCVVSVYPANRQSLLQLFASKPSIGVLLLKSLLKEAMDSFAKLTSANAFLGQLLRTVHSVCLGYSIIDPSQFNGSQKKEDNASKSDFIDPVLPQARVFVQEFQDNGGAVPDVLTSQFLYADHMGVTGQTYDPEINEIKNEINYIRHFLSIPAEITAAITQKSPAFMVLTAEKLQTSYNKLLHDLAGVCMQIKDDMKMLASGEYSWLAKIFLQIELFEKKSSMVSHQNMYGISYFLADMTTKLVQNYQKLWALPLQGVNNEAFQKVKAFLQKKPEAEKPAEAASSPDAQKALSELQNLAMKIFQYSGLPNDKLSTYKENIASLKALSNPLDADSEARKMRRIINGLFWEVYEASAIKYLKTRENLPVYMKLFFNFGLLDETLLEPEQLAHIYSNADFSDSKYPIYTALEWMVLIYEKKVPTSMNELGLTFFEILKNEHKDAKWKKETDLPKEIDTPEARIKYEIKNLFEPTVKITSGSAMNHFAILSKYNITQSMERAVVTKKILEGQIDDLLDKDFGVFHREVLFENEELGINREFIQTRVVPNFIIVPSSGPNFQHWQEREGKNRASRGRLICPVLAMTDLFTMLLNAAGAYRWEMLKTILGLDWNNISQSSLTADYVDYVQFFKKNRELSPEVKEKLSAEFKRFRDDRSRFVHDYGIWVKFESEGTQRLNKVVRKIFTKHIPFSKKYREHLLTLPSFTDMVNKSQNLRKRKAMELEPRYKKYQQTTGELPKELSETIKFYLGDY